MHFQNSATAIAAMLASASLVQQAAAHCKFIDAYGDADPNAHGQAMLIDNAIPLDNGGQNPWQYDVTVFSDPIVPPVPGHPQYGKRQWMAEGCGATISTSNLWRSLYDKAGWGKVGEWDKNYHWYMNPLPKATESFIQTLWETSKAASTNKVPVCTQSGWINIKVHRVNQDGAGPFRCRIDSDGQGKYGADLEIIGQVSGNGGIECCKDLWKFDLKVKIPADQQCNVKSGGKENICIIRCENGAPNGPFGGCIPFQLKGAPKPEVVVPPQTPKLITNPNYGNAGYDVNQGNTKEYAKRAINKKWIRRANAAEAVAAEADKAE
ncbi:hypothetical protein ABW20_dc0105879 [Dactylellina cionopaga]|nr:hypothetical protein ABW20_dc0105879 [Dactylellina cionopaga]